MSAETPQPAAAETPQPSAQTAQAAGGNNTLRIVILVVIAALIGLGLWLAFGQTSKHKKKKASENITTAIGPVALSKSQLQNKASIIGQPMWWAGPQKGYHYEFWRLKNDRIFVRYLPVGTKAGAPGAKYLIVGTYPLANAYNSLKKLAKGRGVAGPNGSFIWVRPGDPKSVYIVWPNRPYEVEVYTPKPGKSLKIASSQIVTVG